MITIKMVFHNYTKPMKRMRLGQNYIKLRFKFVVPIIK